MQLCKECMKEMIEDTSHGDFIVWGSDDHGTCYPDEECEECGETPNEKPIKKTTPWRYPS